MHSDLIHIIASSSICFVLIAVRTAYRLACRCSHHVSCHRTWHQDDAWMAFALLPMLIRAVCISETLLLTEPGRSDKEQAAGRKMLLVARICYALFLWCLKLCLINFYTRFEAVSAIFQKGLRIIWWIVVLSFAIVLMVTLLECRPLSDFWRPRLVGKPQCTESLGNLLTMAILNIITDLGLILLPISVLVKIQLSPAKKLQLFVIFSMGIFVIAVTIARIPLILDYSVSQQSRSLWGSVEIATACIVANVAFYYALIKDLHRGHKNAKSTISANAATRDVMSTTPRHINQSYNVPYRSIETPQTARINNGVRSKQYGQSDWWDDKEWDGERVK